MLNESNLFIENGVAHLLDEGHSKALVQEEIDRCHQTLARLKEKEHAVRSSSASAEQKEKELAHIANQIRLTEKDLRDAHEDMKTAV